MNLSETALEQRDRLAPQALIGHTSGHQPSTLQKFVVLHLLEFSHRLRKQSHLFVRHAKLIMQPLVLQEERSLLSEGNTACGGVSSAIVSSGGSVDSMGDSTATSSRLQSSWVARRTRY